VGRGGIDRVRVNRLSWGTQVVIDLQGGATWKHFTLARTKKKSDRIVLDVTPTSATRTAVPASVSGLAGRPADVFVVAVDAGHGGKDQGTRSGSLVEKRLVLDVARRVASEIDSRPGFKAVLTRDRDVYLSLPQRVRIAEARGADVFVSIHMNSAPNRSARGAEVFFISPSGARRTASRMLADPNRAADELGLRGRASSDVLHMLVDVNQQAVLQRSERLAEAILREFGKNGLPPRRAVKQKSFAVLRNIKLPSVLVECGFLSNRSDARLIGEGAGRDRIAGAVADGVCGFLRANPPPRDRGRPLLVHKVRAGDTLWELSREYGSTVADIRELNRLSKAGVIRVGQELLIYGRY
jgi:N-acetylmuramoyl-L-alanine amidase